jgi:hypothetical protein
MILVFVKKRTKDVRRSQNNSVFFRKYSLKKILIDKKIFFEIFGSEINYNDQNFV